MAAHSVALSMVITLLLTTSFFSPVGADVDLEKMCTKETLTTALWTYFFQGTCYATHGSEIDRTMSYYDAKDACNDISGLTGHLGVFPDNFATLFPFMPAVFTVAVDFTLFIGLEQHKKSEASEPGKQWYWVFPDGSKTTLSSGFWVEGQPADSNGTKNVGAFMRRGNAFGLGNVDADTPIDGYVCQYDLKVKKGQIESSESPELDPAPMNSTGHPGTTGSNNNVTQNNSIESYTNNTVPGNNTIVLGNSTRLEAETTAAWNVTTIPLSNIIEADMNLERMCTKETLTTALWTYFFQGTCYATHGSEIDMTMSYSDAKDACNDIPGLTGHLAVFPDNFAEYFPLMRLVFTVPVDFTLFMGAKYKNKSSASEPGKEWYWLFPDGSKTVVSSGFWMEGQPDDSNGTKNTGAFMRRGNTFGLGNVNGRTPVDGYVCQYDIEVKKGTIPSTASQKNKRFKKRVCKKAPSASDTAKQKRLRERAGCDDEKTNGTSIIA